MLGFYCPKTSAVIGGVVPYSPLPTASRNNGNNSNENLLTDGIVPGASDLFRSSSTPESGIIIIVAIVVVVVP